MDSIIPTLSNEEYHNAPEYHDYWSSTQLRNYLKGPAVAKEMHDNPEHKETPAMRLGSLIHEMLEYLHNASDFTLSEFEKMHPVFNPPVNPKTGQPYGETTAKYTEAYLTFLETLEGGKTAASKEDLELCHIHAQNIENNRFLRAAICNPNSIAEASHFHEAFGGQIKLKWRPDLETKNFIFDWKTISSDLTDDSIRRRILDSGYDVQAAMYQALTYEQSQKWKASIIVWFQTVAPYNIRIDRLNSFAYPVEGGERLDNEVTYTHGAVQYEKILDAHIYCTTNNTWPGGDISIEADERGNRIHDMTLPEYMNSKIVEFYF